MSNAPDQSLLEVLLDSWDRNNTILINLLHAIPKAGLEARAMQSSPSELPREEWAAEPDPIRMAQLLNDSAKAVRDAVKSRVEAGREMNLHYDHPILLLQHMVWHEGYHHGQIKLVLKLAGHPMGNEEAGPLTWRIWMDKKMKSSEPQ